jgi:hypothetical protein
MTDLLPCPFCGGEAVMDEIENSVYDGVRFSVGCATEDKGTCMGYQSLTSFARRSDAAAEWNKRTPEPLNGRIVELLREIDRLQEALKELHAMVMGECPSLLDEDSGGNARLDADIHALLDPVSSAKGSGND